MTILENLREARRLYAANPSHAPYAASPAKGTVCPIFALCDATGFRGREYEDAVAVFEEVTGTKDDTRAPNYIAKWNAERTTEEVLAGFDAAIALAQLRDDMAAWPAVEKVSAHA